MAPIQFGILMIPYQLLDAAGPADILSSARKEYLKGMGHPAEVYDAGVEIEFHHIGEDLSPLTLTGNYTVQPTTTYDACPPLDYLLVGGPTPDYRLPPSFVQFVQTRAKEVKILFTTCTGGMVVAQTGILDGKNATTNHEAIPIAQKMYPQVKWTKEKQWVIDGNFWTAGGACAGMDMMAHWVLTNYGKEVAKASWAALDYEPRDVNAKRVLL